MANVINTVPVQETEGYNLYVKPLLDDPQIQSLPFDMLVGPFKNHELYFTQNLDKISSKKVACGWNFNGSTDVTKKTLVPVEIEAAVEQCYTPLINTIYAGGLPDGWRRGELSAEVLAFMATQQQYAFNRDLLSFLFLGDTISAVPYYTPFDGIYKKLKAGANASDGTVFAGAITASDLNATNFFATMKGIYDAQNRQLKGVAKNLKTWIWTEAVYDAYLNYLYVSTQTNAGIIQRESIVNGLEANFFLNIPILVVPIVDERLEEDFLTGSPAAPTNPYRVILTDPSNHKLLMDANGLAQQEAWYERKDDTYYLIGSALIAYEYGFGDLNVIAGF